MQRDREPGHVIPLRGKKQEAPLEEALGQELGLSFEEGRAIHILTKKCTELTGDQEAFSGICHDAYEQALGTWDPDGEQERQHERKKYDCVQSILADEGVVFTYPPIDVVNDVFEEGGWGAENRYFFSLLPPKVVNRIKGELSPLLLPGEIYRMSSLMRERDWYERMIVQRCAQDREERHEKRKALLEDLRKNHVQLYRLLMETLRAVSMDENGRMVFYPEDSPQELAQYFRKIGVSTSRGYHQFIVDNPHINMEFVGDDEQQDAFRATLTRHGRVQSELGEALLELTRTYLGPQTEKDRIDEILEKVLRAKTQGKLRQEDVFYANRLLQLGKGRPGTDKEILRVIREYGRTKRDVSVPIDREGDE